MLSNTARGRAFQICCRDALKRVLSCDFDLEVPIDIGGGKFHSFDLATRERDIVAECKAFKFTDGGNIPSAKITTLREAAADLRLIQRDLARLLIVKRDVHPKRGETLGRHFVRLNTNRLEQVTVLEMLESGGDLDCIHGVFPPAQIPTTEPLDKPIERLLATPPLPALFVEGESDVAILTAAWQSFHPTEPLPVTILVAGGTRQMESLASKGRALRQVLGDRLVFALADNDREGRELVEDGRTKRGGIWKEQTNGIHWCLLAPTTEFEQAMKRSRIDAAYWPFTIENAFPAALRRQAIADGAYRVEEARVQAAFLEEPATAVKALDAVRDLDRTDDDAVLYFRPPAPETKLAFSEWIAAPERRDRATFAAFGPILEGLRAILSPAPQRQGSRGAAAAK